VIMLRGGTLAEPPGKGGVAAVTAELLQRGTRKHPGEQLATALDAIGAQLSVDASSDMTMLSLSTLTKHLDEALDLTAEVLAEPTLSKETFEKVRAEAIADFKASEEDPNTVASRAFLRALYDGHPYGRRVEGSEESLRTLTREDCVAYWKKVSGAKGAILTAAGDVTGPDLARRTRRHLAPWLAHAGTPFGAPPPLPPPEGPRIEKLDRPFTQSTILVGERGISRTDPDYYALQIFNYVLGGGGFSSRLLDEIRDNLGLAYSVSSGFDARLLPGPFVISLQTKNKTAREALRLVRNEVQRALREGITEKELSDAKAYLTGSYPRRYDTDAKMARFLAATAFYGLGSDYDRVYPAKIRAVTLEEVLQAARAHVHPDRFVTTVVGRLRQAGWKER
jgi:zinc protease